MKITRSKVISIALILSLALNLLFVGGVVARFLMHPPPRPLPSNLEWLVSDIPKETRMKFRAGLDQHRKTVRGLRQNMFKAQRDFYHSLENEELDEEALNVSLSKLRKTSDEFQRATHSQMIPILLELDVEHRGKALRSLRMRYKPRCMRHKPRCHFDGNRTEG